MKAQRTFEDRFHELRPGLYWRLWRDLRCAAFIAAMIFRNLTIGRRVRKKYVDCKKRGEPFWLDDETATKD